MNRYAINLTVWLFALPLACLPAAPGWAGEVQRTYFVGNSLTDAIDHPKVQSFASIRRNQLTYGSHLRWGASLQYLWEHPTDISYAQPPFGGFQNAFANHQWDVVSLQPFGKPLEGPTGDRTHVANFINLARVNSPNARFYLYEQWPEKPEKGEFDFNEMWDAPYSGEDDLTVRTRDYYETLTQTIRLDFPSLSTPAMLVPAGDVMYELNRRMHNGQLPGFADIDQFYGDNIHLNAVGKYMLSVTFYATMFKETPVGLPFDNTVIPNPAVALQIQDAAWDVVSTHPLSGVDYRFPRYASTPVHRGVPEPATAGAIALIALVASLKRRR